MSLFNGKFIVNIPPSDFFSRSQITLTRNRVDFSLGNSFKRVVPSGDQYFRFFNVEDKREVYLVVQNSSLTEEANVYLPPGFWKENTIVSLLAPDSRMLIRIVTQDSQLYYETLDDMALLTAPAPNADAGFFNVVNESTVYGFDVETTQHNSLFYINSTGSVRNVAVATGRPVFEDSGVGLLEPLLTKYLSDTRIERILVDEANELAYVIGSFDQRFNQSSVPGTTGTSIFEVDLSNGSFAVFKANAPVLSGEAILADGKIILKRNSGLGIIAYELATGDTAWEITQGPSIFSLSADSTHVYMACIERLGSKIVGAGLHFVGKVALSTGTIDETFIDNQAPFNGSTNIQSVLIHSGSLFFGMTGSVYSGSASQGLVKLSPATGIRDLSVAVNTGITGGRPVLFAGAANVIYFSAVGGSYLNAGSAVPGINHFFKISTINGFADGAFSLGLTFSSTSNQVITALYKGTNLFINGTSSVDTPATFNTISKVNPNTGVIDSLYQPVAVKINSSLTLLSFQDFIISYGNSPSIRYASTVYKTPGANIYLMKYDLETRVVSSISSSLGSSINPPRVVTVGNNANSNKVFIGLQANSTGLTYASILRVFNATTLVEESGFPTFNTLVGGTAQINSIIQVGNLLYVSGQWRNSQDTDGVYANSPGFAVIDITTKKVIRDSKYSLPFVWNTTTLSFVVKASQYGDRIYIQNSQNGFVNCIDTISGEVLGDVKLPNILAEAVGFQAYSNGFVFSGGQLSYACVVFKKEKLFFKAVPPSTIISSPEVSNFALSELDQKVSGVASHAVLGGQRVRFFVDTTTDAATFDFLPPVSNLGLLPEFFMRKYVVPFVNYLSDMFFSALDATFNNKSRTGVLRLNSSISDTDEAANPLELPTSISVSSSVEVKIKKDTNLPVLSARNTVKAEIRGTNIPTGLMVNPLTGNIQGRVEDATIGTFESQYSLVNKLGSVNSNSMTVNVVDRAPWRNIAVGNGISNGFIRSTIEKSDRLFVGGDFSHIGVVYNGIAKIATNGQLDRTSLAKCHDFNGDVKRVYVNGSDLYAFGTFTKYGEFDYPYFVKINLSTGEADHTFMNGLGSGFGGFTDMQFPVAYAQALGNTIYIAGSFITLDGVSCGNVVALNKNTGEVDDAFNAGVTTGGSIRDMVFEAVEGRLWLVGTFTQFAGNANARSLAVLSPLTGVLNPTFFASQAFNGNATRIIAKDGNLFIAGSFTQYQATTHNYLVKLNGNNGTASVGFSLFNAATDPLIQSLSSSDTTIAMATNAGQYDGNSMTGFLSILIADGSFVSTASATGTTSVHGLASDQYVVGGTFSQMNAVDSRRLAIVNGLDGTNVTVYSGDQYKQQRAILDVKSYSGSLIITNSDAWELQARETLAAFEYTDALGIQLLTSFPNVAGSGKTVRKLIFDFSGDFVFAGGEFDTYNSISSNHLVKFNAATGAIDASFDIGVGFDGLITDFDYSSNFFPVQSGQSMIVVGDFANYKGSAADKLVYLNGIGGAFSPGVNNIGSPRKVVHLYNGVLIVEGFTQINGTAIASGIARLSGNSSGGQPAGLASDPTGNKISTDVFRNLYVYNNTFGTVRRYCAVDSYDSLNFSQTYTPAGTESVFSNQGNFMTLGGDLGSPVTYNAIPYSASIISIKTLDLAKDTRIEIADTQSGSGRVRDIVANGNTAQIVSTGTSADLVPFVNGLYGNMIRVNKSGATTPYNY